MPFGGAPLPTPDQPVGITGNGGITNTIANVGVGAGFAAASNIMVGQFSGLEVNGIAAFANFFFQWFKQFGWFDQHRWWPLALLAICLPIFWIGTHGDVIMSFAKAGLAAAQANINYNGMKATGMNLFEPSKLFPGNDGHKIS